MFAAQIRREFFGILGLGSGLLLRNLGEDPVTNFPGATTRAVRFLIMAPVRTS